MLQSSASIRDMDMRCPKRNKLAKKEEKDFSGKNKFTDSPSANTSSRKQSSSTQQTFSTNPKKDQDHQQGPWRRGKREQGCNTNSPATGVNIVPKKEGKDRDMSKVKCYNCHRKGHYSNKYSWNPKEKSKN